MHRCLEIPLLASVLALGAHAAPLAPPQFQTVEEITGRDASLSHISTNGKTLAGTFINEGRAAAFRYSAKDGFQVLATDLPPNTEGVWTGGMSDEGKIVYGHLQYDQGGSVYMEGFVWSTTGGFQRTGLLSPGKYTVARCVSGNNKTVGGQAIVDSVQSCFTWTEREGIRTFASQFPDFPASAGYPAWISNNRRRVWAGGGATRVMLWNAGKELVEFQDPPGGDSTMDINAITPNGRHAFGYVSNEIGSQAAYFRQDGVAELLFPGSELESLAIGASSDGRLVCGHAYAEPGPFSADTNFFLDRRTGRVTFLSAIVPGLVPELTAWTGVQAFGISGDGNTLIGYGFDSENTFRYWVLRGVRKHLQPKAVR